MHQETIRFYSNVIEEFIELVEKQYKGKGSLSSDQIEKMKKSLRQKIKDPSKYHKQIVSNFFDKSISLTPPAKNNQHKIQSAKIQYPKGPEVIKNSETQKVSQKIHQDSQTIKSQNALNLKSADDEEDDDLNQFKKKFEGKSHLPKIQQPSQQEKNQSVSKDLYDFSSDDEDQKLNAEELAKIKEKTGMHILGSYNTKEKKFNSKKEQTKLTLYNTFFKIHGHDHELLFPVVQIVATRVSKGQINI